MKKKARLLLAMLQLSKNAVVITEVINKVKETDPKSARELRKRVMGYVKDNTK